MPGAIATGDIDGDGAVDFVTANENGGDVSLLLGDGTGGFGAPASFPSGSLCDAVDVADLDADGDLELLAANRGSDDFVVWSGDGTGGFGAPTSYRTGDGPRAFTTADFDSDGALDLATANDFSGDVTVHRGNGAGGFGTLTSYSASLSLRDAAVADLDDDEAPDLALAEVGGRWRNPLGDGSGGFTTGSGYLGGAFPDALKLADLDRDDRPEAILANGDGTAYVHENLACRGSFAAYGEGLAGSGGVAPSIGGLGCPEVGGSADVQVWGGVGAASASLLIGTAAARIPALGGTLLVAPIAAVETVLGGTAGYPGAGTRVITLPVPTEPELAGLSVYGQFVTLDSGAPFGAAMSPGLQVTLGA